MDIRAHSHILGLCPLLAVSHKLVYGLCLGLCTALVMVVSAAISPRLLVWFPSSVRLVVHMLVIGTLVIAIELILQAYFYDLHQILGLFVPLIITNCAILAHCEQSSAAKQSMRANLVSSLKVGGGFIVILSCVSALRELFGHASLLDDIELFLGETAGQFTIEFSALFAGVPVALLPCGAFFALAAVIAALRAYSKPRTEKTSQEIKLHYHART